MSYVAFELIVLCFFFFWDFREELRKWFLSMESTLFRYRFRIEGPDVRVWLIKLFFNAHLYISLSFLALLIIDDGALNSSYH